MIHFTEQRERVMNVIYSWRSAIHRGRTILITILQRGIRTGNEIVRTREILLSKYCAFFSVYM